MTFIFSNKKPQNILTYLLGELKVKYTDSFSNKYFNEHPHKYNLFGLSTMLSEYGIDNKGIKIKDKNTGIHSIDPPFVVYAGGDFGVVSKITTSKVNYLWKGRLFSAPIAEFNKQWSGIILIPEPTEDSIEPGYFKNRRKELINGIQKGLLLAATILLCITSFIHNQLYNNWSIGLLIIINLLGIYTGYLLVLKQMRIHSNYADKICSLFKQSDCNDVLESKAAKLWDIIGWSEIGLGYFISNLIVLLIIPLLLPYLILINICTLPYSLWSVWYQKVKAKQWCPLCLIVQVLFWGVFFVNLLSGFIQLPDFNINNILLTGVIYGIPPLLINLLIPQFTRARKMEQVTYEINSLKASEVVFSSLLKKRPHYEVDKSTSNILFGNQDANLLVTIFTNPHCEPCAKMHARMEKLLNANNSNSICIQYIFSSFNEKLIPSNQFLIATYFANKTDQTRNIYNQWFGGEKHNKDSFMKKYSYSLDEKVKNELITHEEWKEKTKLQATPTILVNGYQLPDNYKIEDLKYFTHLDIDAK